MKKLYNSQIISKLVVVKLLRTIILLMRNFKENFAKILGICNDFVGMYVGNIMIAPCLVTRDISVLRFRIISLKRSISHLKFQIGWIRKTGVRLRGHTRKSVNELKRYYPSSTIILWWYETTQNNPADFLPVWQAKSPQWHLCNMLISLIIVRLGR